jgi:hypothetical protein
MASDGAIHKPEPSEQALRVEYAGAGFGQVENLALLARDALLKLVYGPTPDQSKVNLLPQEINAASPQEEAQTLRRLAAQSVRLEREPEKFALADQSFALLREHTRQMFSLPGKAGEAYRAAVDAELRRQEGDGGPSLELDRTGLYMAHYDNAVFRPDGSASRNHYLSGGGKKHEDFAALPPKQP